MCHSLLGLQGDFLELSMFVGCGIPVALSVVRHQVGEGAGDGVREAGARS